MVIIKNLSDKYFELNSIRFAKIYQPLAQGSKSIGIYSIYDTRHQLVNSTNFSEFIIDDIVYSTQAATIQAILSVVWAAVSDYDVDQLSVRVENIEDNQVTGVHVYATLAELPATGTLLVSYKVTNDTTSSNNGYYHWSGSAYVKDAEITLDSGLLGTDLDAGDYKIINLKDAVGFQDAMNRQETESYLNDKKIHVSDIKGISKNNVFKENLLDGVSFTTGSYINGSGVITVNSGLSYSEELIVTPLTKYAVYNDLVNTIAWYDSTQTFIKMSGGTVASYNQEFIFQSPSNAAYCRLNAQNSDIDNYRFSAGSLYTSGLMTETEKENSRSSVADLDGAEKTAIFKENILDSVSFTDGSYIETDGVITVLASLSYSDEIAVTPLTKYAVYNGIRNSIAWYDESHNFIYMSGVVPDVLLTEHVFQSPSNAAYCRINKVNSVGSTYRLSKGSLYTIELKDVVFSESFKLKDKKFSIMGDSISTYNGYIPAPNVTFYPAGDVTDVNLTWWKKLEALSQMNLLVNESWSGSRITLDSAGVGYVAGKAFTELSRYSNLDSGGNDPEIILVLGGINDWISVGDALPNLGSYPVLGSDKSTWNLKDFKEAYPFLIESLLRTYPDARIFFCIPLQMEGQGATTPFSDNDSIPAWTRQEMNEAIKYLCDQYGVDFIDLSKCGVSFYNESTNLIDGVHPKASGMQLMCDYIYAELLSKI